MRVFFRNLSLFGLAAIAEVEAMVKDAIVCYTGDLDRLNANIKDEFEIIRSAVHKGDHAECIPKG